GADFIAVGVSGLRSPMGILFGPDGTGDGQQDLYVTSCVYQNSFKSKAGTNMVLRFDSATGEPAPSPGNSGAVFVAADSGGLDDPVLMTFTETNPTTLAYAETAVRSFATPSGTMATSQAIASPTLVTVLVVLSPEVQDIDNAWPFQTMTHARKRGY